MRDLSVMVCVLAHVLTPWLEALLRELAWRVSVCDECPSPVTMLGAFSPTLGRRKVHPGLVPLTPPHGVLTSVLVSYCVAEYVCI